MSDRTFAELAHDLRTIVDEITPELERISDAAASSRPTAKGWSKKESLAHLIDSASNNHQRFVRAVEQKGGTFPGYDPDFLTKLQRSNEAPWSLIVALWSSYNRYLAHILAGLPQDAASYRLEISNNPSGSLAFIAADYLEHLKHHLNDIVGERYHSTYAAAD